MLSRNFSKREKILLVVLCALLFGLLYYQFVIKEVNQIIEANSTEELETELLTEQSRAMDIVRMKKEMDENKSMTNKVVASYNNVKNEISALNTIFANAVDYNLNFSDPVKEGDAVRRVIDISFTARSYDGAVSIIKELYNCKYRCLIRNINISPGSSTGGINSGTVSVNLQVTFFETMFNADTQQGLEEIKDETIVEEETEE
ncbi:hypothetical protein M2140_001215 [Clostridiales Family XIII bacterium PM5-7]